MLTNRSTVDSLRGNTAAHNFAMIGKSGVFSENVMLNNKSIRADSTHVLKKACNDFRGDQIVATTLLKREVGSSRFKLDNICHNAHLPCAVC